MSVISTTGGTSSSRVRTAKWALSSALIAIVLKLWTMQVLHYDLWSEESRQTLTRNSSLPAPRGVIYDREGHVLAGNEPLWAVVVTLDDVDGYESPPWILSGVRVPAQPEGEPPESLVDDKGKPTYSPPPDALVRVSQILCDIINAAPERQGPDPAKPPLDWVERLDHLAQYNYAAWRPAPFADDLNHDVVMRIMERLPELRGVEVVRRFRRDYEHPLNANGFHLVGYVQRITYERRHLLEPEYGYEMTDSVGMTGIEARYEKMLRGVKGREVIGIEGTPKIDRPAEPGVSLSLTIDAKLQAEMERSLRQYVDYIGAPGGAAIAMDPQSGEIYALASYPAFRSEWFAPDASPEERAAYADAEKDGGARGAWNNQAIAYQRAPASSFKFVTLTAALEEGVIDPNYTAYCSGKLMLGSTPKLCWNKAGHQSVGITRSLAVSCNVFYYGLGVKLGEEPLVRWARNFGFGEPTGIDLPDEEPGIVGDRTYLINVKNESGWYAGDSANFAIGQGSITATPIQVAVATAVIANGGRRVVPHVVGRVTQAGKPQPPVTQQRDPVTVPIKPTTLDLVRKGLRAVVASETGGTAFHAFSGEGWIPRVPVAGKTGSSEIDSDDAWFTCYAPYVDMNPSSLDSIARSNAAPKIVVTVLIMNGGHGGDAAAPVARDVVAAAFDESGHFVVRPTVAR